MTMQLDSLLGYFAIWPPDTKLFVNVNGVIHEIVSIEPGPVFGSAQLCAEPRVVESIASLA